MLSKFKKIGWRATLGALALGIGLAGASVATAPKAEAYGWYGWHHGWYGGYGRGWYGPRVSFGWGGYYPGYYGYRPYHYYPGYYYPGYYYPYGGVTIGVR